MPPEHGRSGCEGGTLGEGGHGPVKSLGPGVTYDSVGEGSAAWSVASTRCLVASSLGTARAAAASACCAVRRVPASSATFATAIASSKAGAPGWSSVSSFFFFKQKTAYEI